MAPQRIFWLLSLCLGAFVISASAQTLVNVNDTLYNADGTKASGRLVISWDPFTSGGVTVDGGTLTYTIPSSGVNQGVVNVSLYPNAGATPAGTSYRAQYFLANRASYSETWVVPATGPVTIAAVRALPAPTPVDVDISSLNGLTAAVQTFTHPDDTNVTLGITSSGSNHAFTTGWAGTLAAARLNANVVQAVTNDTNVTGSIASQNLTLGWTGALAVARGGTGAAPGADDQALISDSATAATWRAIPNCNSENMLTYTAGTNAFGCESDTGPNHNLLSATHPDTSAASAVFGDLIYGNATPAWQRLAGNITTAKQFLSQTGTGAASAAPAWSALADGDIPDTITLTNLTQITNRAIGDTTGDLAASRVDDGGVASTQALFSGAGAAAGFRAIADGDIPAAIARDTESPAAGDITGSLSAGYQIGAGAVTDAEVNASGITTRSKLPAALAYEDEANTFTGGLQLVQGSAGLLRLELENPDAPADDSFADSPESQFTGIRDSLAGAGVTREEINWKSFVDVTAVAGTSNLVFQSRIGAAAFGERAKLTDGGVLDVPTGFRIGGAAATNNVLAGNGTNFVSTATSGTGAPLGTGRTISTSGAALSGGGDLSANRTLTLSASPDSASVVGIGRLLTGGAGIAALGDLSADRTIATASGETDFLASGALTCGAATQGRAQVHTTPLQYCDNAATPTLQYAAYGDSTGKATIALDLQAASGVVSDAELASNYSGVGGCTNQFARTLNDNAAPTCATVALATDVGTFSSADLLGRLTDETGGSLAVFSASPTLTGTVTIDRRLEFTEAVGDPACAAGDFWISATSTTNVLRKCQNGSLADLDTGGAGGDSISVNGVSATDADFDDTTPAAPGDGVNVRWQKDALTPNNLSANVPTTSGGSAGTAAFNVGTATTVARSDHEHRTFAQLSWFFPGAPSTGIQTAVGTLPDGIGSPDLTDMRVTVNTTSASSSTFNIQRCTAACTGASPTFANIYSTDLTLAANTRTAAKAAAPNQNVTGLAAGDQFKINIATLGSGAQDVTVTMTYRMRNTN